MASRPRRLTIVGLGLIGGSLGLALKAADPGLEIVGHNRSHEAAGKELSGIDAAEADLFRGATWCIVPGRRCAPEAVTAVESLVRMVGAQPYFLDAEEHDSYVAAISHVPFIASAALVNAVTAAPSWRDMARMAAGGFRDATRTASGDVRMHVDICRTNREGIVRWLDAYADELRRVRDLVASTGQDEAELEAFFAAAKEARDHWLAGRGQPPTAELAAPMPTARESLTDLLFGRRRPRERR